MTLDEILQSRRSIRAYQDRPVPEEHIVALCEAARLAPSACNGQTWRFVAVTDAGLRERVCREGMRAVVRNPWLIQAPLIIAGCSDLDLVANRIGTAVTGTEYYQLDLGIAMEHMVLKATELGLGTCWIGWFKENKIKEILQIPRKLRVPVLLAVGHPEPPLPAPRPRKSLDAIAMRDTWGSPLQANDEKEDDS